MQENTPFGVSELLVQAQRMKKWYEEALHAVAVQYGLTMNELSVLLFLANNPVHDTATDIVEVRHLTKSHVSASVKTLQARGYLQRVFLAGNHKTVHLRLTPAAGPVVEQGRRAQQSFFATLQKGLAPAKRAVLKAAFHKMLKNARTALQGGRGTV